ncbi:MAG: SDR family oxidoreductase [Geminicoccaceae bacterium]
MDDHRRLVDLAMECWGRIDVLVNSAGHGPKGPILDISDEDWHLGMEVYLLNVVRPARLVTHQWWRRAAGDHQHLDLRHLRAGPALSHLRHLPHRPRQLRQALRQPLRRRQRALEQHPARLHRRPAGTADRRARIPMGRYGTTGEVSALIAYLASDVAAYVTGQNLRIDGGLTASV